jgi:soluble lytic murein transglycosylase
MVPASVRLPICGRGHRDGRRTTASETLAPLRRPATLMIDLIKRYKWWLFGIIILGGLVTWFESWRDYREHSQDGVILAASAKYGVDPALIKAVVWRESWFNPRATGSSGEVGLMQIMKDTASDWAAAERFTLDAHSQLYNPTKNTECGAWYLRRLLNRYRNTDNPVVYALAGYNAGPTRVAKWGQGAAATNSVEFLKAMDFPGTRKYIQSVRQRHQHYRKEFSSKRADSNSGRQRMAGLSPLGG